jgi:hypothetical protein
MVQIHKKFIDEQVKDLMKKYLNKEVERKYLQEVLGIKKRRFFVLVKNYKENPDGFSIHYTRRIRVKKISQAIENNIIKELKIDKKAIENKETPLKRYNYSYVKTRLSDKYKQKVSLPTIINRAKKYDFYLNNREKRVHDREVLTNYVGQLIQHDSSYHLWSPPAREKWCLITSLDDFSRFILYAIFLDKETSWQHIFALQTVILKYGIPFSYYVDCHSIFRFVQGRDSLWRNHHLLTDDVDPQWKQVASDCNFKVTYALSPQAKGKIERPYRWMQDRIVRTCIRENVTSIKYAQRILDEEVDRYNHRQYHSTTKEIPSVRFQRALNEKKSLFREFKIPPPFESVKDIFCLRANRVIDAYRKISLNNLQLKVNNATPRETVTLRIYPMTNGVSEVRFWCNNKLIDVQMLKNSDLEGVQF